MRVSPLLATIFCRSVLATAVDASVALHLVGLRTDY